VRLRRDRIVVALEHKVLSYNFADLKLLHQIETLGNSRGLLALSSTADSTVLACPGLHTGQVRASCTCVNVCPHCTSRPAARQRSLAVATQQQQQQQQQQRAAEYPCSLQGSVMHLGACAVFELLVHVPLCPWCVPAADTGAHRAV
jgi:hypothetical protein